jgi:telomerase Cajal body protein 1
MSVDKDTQFHLLASSNDTTNLIPNGVRFSPDGLCLLTSMRDELRLYNIFSTSEPTIMNQSPKPWNADLICKGGDKVQSYDWYPFMDSQNPASCCFLATSREQPIHLYDAYNGQIRATYSPFNPEREEPVSPLLGIFDSTGTRVFCGGFSTDRFLYIFDTSRPGKEFLQCFKLGKTRRSKDGQKGLVSSMCCAIHTPNLLAVGTYSPGSIYLYDTRVSGHHEIATVLNGGISVVGHGKRMKRFHVDDEDENIFSVAKARWFQGRAQTGVTQLTFCENDHSLLSTSRRSDAVLKWDLRMITAPDHSMRPICGIASYAADQTSNQRIGFHVEGNDLYVGGRDKSVKCYDIASGKLQHTIRMLDVVNGVSFHTNHLAVSLGEWTFEDDRLTFCGGIQLFQKQTS